MGKRRDTQDGINAVTYAERQRQALELRKAGVTYEAIAERLGYENASGPQKAVKKALAAMVQEPAEDLRQLELARLDAMLLAIWPKVKAGNEYAIDRALKIQLRRAQLLGLDAPSSLKITHTIDREQAAQLAEQYGLDPDEVIAEAERHLAEARAVS